MPGRAVPLVPACRDCSTNAGIRPNGSLNIATGQSDTLGPQRFCDDGIDRERADARTAERTIRNDTRNIAVLAIDSADTVEVWRGGAPYRCCGALLCILEVAAGIDNGTAVFIHGAELLNLFAGKMACKGAEDGARMD